VREVGPPTLALSLCFCSSLLEAAVALTPTCPLSVHLPDCRVVVLEREKRDWLFCFLLLHLHLLLLPLLLG